MKYSISYLNKLIMEEDNLQQQLQELGQKQHIESLQEVEHN